ncbi:MAG: hypothetical protein V3V10_01205 [Planctomycetota bacterium]
MKTTKLPVLLVGSVLVIALAVTLILLNDNHVGVVLPTSDEPDLEISDSDRQNDRPSSDTPDTSHSSDDKKCSAEAEKETENDTGSTPKEKDAYLPGNQDNNSEATEKTYITNGAPDSQTANPLQVFTGPWPKDIPSKTVETPIHKLLLKKGETLDNVKEIRDGSFTPVFVDIDRLSNVRIAKIGGNIIRDTERWIRRDGALEIKVDALQLSILKIDVLLVSGGDQREPTSWSYEWHDKTQSDHNMFVPYSHGDSFLVRTHLSTGEIIESYVSDVSLYSEGSAHTSSISEHGFEYVDIRQPVKTGGTFTTLDAEGKPVTDVLLLDYHNQVLARSGSDGVLNWNNLLLESGSDGLYFPVVLTKPGHLPVLFKKKLPKSGIQHIGAKSLLLSIPVQDLSYPAPSTRRPQSQNTRNDLLPLMPCFTPASRDDAFGILYFPDYDRDPETHRYAIVVLPLIDWSWWLIKKKFSFEAPGFSEKRGNLSDLRKWSTHRWKLTEQGTLHIGLPKAGKYLLAVGDNLDVPTTDLIYGRYTHLIFIDATDPAQATARAFQR